MHDANDVVAYELRTAHRFARRVIPVVLAPGSVPPLASLPSDFEWFAQLNAFIMPEPPEHRAYLVQLAELVTSTLAAEHEAAPRVFSVPGDAEMLRDNARITIHPGSELAHCPEPLCGLESLP